MNPNPFDTYPADPTPQNVEEWFEAQIPGSISCEDCGFKKPDVEFCICPMMLELREQRVPAILCTDCYAGRFDLS